MTEQCRHEKIQTWRLESGEPAGLWSCVQCTRKFAPLDVTAPAWRDAPDAPGLWLCNLDMQAYELPDPEIDLGGGNRWYGPIPSEDKP